jgi:hypothetical protein
MQMGLGTIASNDVAFRILSKFHGCMRVGIYPARVLKWGGC